MASGPADFICLRRNLLLLACQLVLMLAAVQSAPSVIITETSVATPKFQPGQTKTYQMTVNFVSSETFQYATFDITAPRATSQITRLCSAVLTIASGSITGPLGQNVGSAYFVPTSASSDEVVFTLPDPGSLNSYNVQAGTAVQIAFTVINIAPTASPPAGNYPLSVLVTEFNGPTPTRTGSLGVNFGAPTYPTIGIVYVANISTPTVPTPLGQTVTVNSLIQWDTLTADFSINIDVGPCSGPSYVSLVSFKFTGAASSWGCLSSLNAAEMALLQFPPPNATIPYTCPHGYSSGTIAFGYLANSNGYNSLMDEPIYFTAVFYVEAVSPSLLNATYTMTGYSQATPVNSAYDVIPLAYPTTTTSTTTTSTTSISSTSTASSTSMPTSSSSTTMSTSTSGSSSSTSITTISNASSTSTPPSSTVTSSTTSPTTTPTATNTSTSTTLPTTPTSGTSASSTVAPMTTTSFSVLTSSTSFTSTSSPTMSSSGISTASSSIPSSTTTTTSTPTITTSTSAPPTSSSSSLAVTPTTTPLTSSPTTQTTIPPLTSATSGAVPSSTTTSIPVSTASSTTSSTAVAPTPSVSPTSSSTPLLPISTSSTVASVSSTPVLSTSPTTTSPAPMMAPLLSTVATSISVTSSTPLQPSPSSSSTVSATLAPTFPTPSPITSTQTTSAAAVAPSPPITSTVISQTPAIAITTAQAIAGASTSTSGAVVAQTTSTQAIVAVTSTPAVSPSSIATNSITSSPPQSLAPQTLAATSSAQSTTAGVTTRSVIMTAMPPLAAVQISTSALPSSLAQSTAVVSTVAALSPSSGVITSQAITDTSASVATNTTLGLATTSTAPTAAPQVIPVATSAAVALTMQPSSAPPPGSSAIDISISTTETAGATTVGSSSSFASTHTNTPSVTTSTTQSRVSTASNAVASSGAPPLTTIDLQAATRQIGGQPSTQQDSIMISQVSELTTGAAGAPPTNAVHSTTARPSAGPLATNASSTAAIAVSRFSIVPTSASVTVTVPQQESTSQTPVPLAPITGTPEASNGLSPTTDAPALQTARSESNAPSSSTLVIDKSITPASEPRATTNKELLSALPPVTNAVHPVLTDSPVPFQLVTDTAVVTAAVAPTTKALSGNAALAATSLAITPGFEVATLVPATGLSILDIVSQQQQQVSPERPSISRAPYSYVPRMTSILEQEGAPDFTLLTSTRDGASVDIATSQMQVNSVPEQISQASVSNPIPESNTPSIKVSEAIPQLRTASTAPSPTELQIPNVIDGGTETPKPNLATIAESAGGNVLFTPTTSETSPIRQTYPVAFETSSIPPAPLVSQSIRGPIITVSVGSLQESTVVGSPVVGSGMAGPTPAAETALSTSTMESSSGHIAPASQSAATTVPRLPGTVISESTAVAGTGAGTEATSVPTGSGAGQTQFSSYAPPPGAANAAKSTTTSTLPLDIVAQGTESALYRSETKRLFTPVIIPEDTLPPLISTGQSINASPETNTRTWQTERIFNQLTTDMSETVTRLSYSLPPTTSDKLDTPDVMGDGTDKLRRITATQPSAATATTIRSAATQQAKGLSETRNRTVQPLSQSTTTRSSPENQPDIVIKATLPQADPRRTYYVDDTVDMNMALSLSPGSMETKPLDILLFTPPHLEFVGITNFNSSLSNNTAVSVTPAANGATILSIPELKIGDLASLDLQFQVKQLPNGNQNNIRTAILMQPISTVNSNDQPTKRAPGKLTHVSLLTSGSACQPTPLLFAQSACRLIASSTASGSNISGLRLDGGSFWSPELRLHEEHWLAAAFEKPVQVQTVIVASDSRQFRRPSVGRLEYSDTGKKWVALQNMHLDYDNNSLATVAVSRPASALYFRFVVTNADNEPADDRIYIGTQLELLGCVSGTSGGTDQKCELPISPAVNDRQFLASESGPSVYYCSYDDQTSKRRCYGSPDGDTWNRSGVLAPLTLETASTTQTKPISISVLPSQIGSISCIDTRSNRIYGMSQSGLQFAASDDGGDSWFPVSTAEYEDAVRSSSSIRSVSVPYSAKGDPAFTKLKSGNWTASFDGLYLSEQRRFTWSDCCSA